MGMHSEDKKIRMKKKKKHFGRKIFFIILLLIAVFAGFLAIKSRQLGGGISGLTAVLLGHNAETAKNLEEFKILILGESTGMTDTIIVASYNPETQKASMLSIPRDTFTGENKNNAKASQKINALSNYGENPEKTLEAVNKITGLDVKNYIFVDTKALVKLVNAIGGIEFNVPIDMDYDDSSQNLEIHLKEGEQKLTGEQVEGLVRFRHNNNGSTYSYEYGIEDYGRMHTQRDVIKALAKQVLQFKNVKEINSIMDIIKENVKSNLNFDEFKDYIPYAMKVDMETIQTEQLPGESKVLNGIWFFLEDVEEADEVINRLFFEQEIVNSENEENINK